MTSRVGEAEVGEMVADFVVGQRLQQEQKFIRDRGHAVPFEKRTERKRRDCSRHEFYFKCGAALRKDGRGRPSPREQG